MHRINQLIKSGQTLFRTADLQVLWEIDNPNTLYSAVQRALRQGVLTRIQKGLYTLAGISQVEPIQLGQKAIHDYAYLSTETVFSQAGVIQQLVPAFTFISTQSKKLQLLGKEYRYRQMKPIFLYNKLGVQSEAGLFRASPERAAADLLYYNPLAYLDNKEALDWELVLSIQKQVGFL